MSRQSTGRYQTDWKSAPGRANFWPPFLRVGGVGSLRSKFNLNNGTLLERKLQSVQFKSAWEMFHSMIFRPAHTKAKIRYEGKDPPFLRVIEEWGLIGRKLFSIVGPYLNVNCSRFSSKAHIPGCSAWNVKADDRALSDWLKVRTG